MEADGGLDLNISHSLHVFIFFLESVGNDDDDHVPPVQAELRCTT